MSIQRGFKPPINSKQLQLFTFISERAVKEIQIEDRSNHITLDTSTIKGGLIDDTVLEENLGLLFVFLLRGTLKETAFKFLLCVMKFDNNETVNILRTLNRLRVRKPCFVENPIIILFFGPFFHAQHVS